MIRKHRKIRLVLEFFGLYVGLPVLLAVFFRGRPFFPVLWGMMALCACVLVRDPDFDRKQLWNARGLGLGWRSVLVRFAWVALLLAAGVATFLPDAFLGFVKRRPGLWAIVMIAYPVLSVYPQSVIYRAFLFHRYREVIPAGAPMIVASALAFGFCHVIFLNGFAVAVTTVGGLLFARSYERSRSLLLCSAEHALYGCLMFTVGLGRFFYHGAVVSQ